MLQARLKCGSSELRVNLAAFSRQTEPDTLRLHRSNPLIAQVLSGKQEPFRLERLDTKKKTYIAVSPFKMLQARLKCGSSELRVNLAAFSRQTEPDTLRLHRSNPLIAQVLSGKQEPFRLERLDTKKKDLHRCKSF